MLRASLEGEKIQHPRNIESNDNLLSNKAQEYSTSNNAYPWKAGSTYTL